MSLGNHNETKNFKNLKLYKKINKTERRHTQNHSACENQQPVRKSNTSRPGGLRNYQHQGGVAVYQDQYLPV